MTEEKKTETSSLAPSESEEVSVVSAPEDPQMICGRCGNDLALDYTFYKYRECGICGNR